MSEIFPKKLRGWRFVLFNLCLGLGHAIVLFNAGAYIAMLPRIAGGLSIPPSFATWTQTDFMLALALGLPVGIWLSRRLGEYRPLVWAFLAFAAASAVCSVSRTLYPYLIARIVQGFAGGLTLPLGQSMLMKEYPDRSKNIGIGVWTLFTLTPFTFGPPCGGWIADRLGWRWLFFIDIPVSLAIAGIVGALLYRRGAQKVRRRFDYSGFLLLTLALGALQTLLNRGNDLDWMNSPFLLGLFGVGAAALCLWVVLESNERHPYLDVNLFARRNFAIGTMVMFFGFMFFQGLLSLLVVQLQLTLGYSAFQAGLVFLPMAIFAKPVAGGFHHIVKRVDARLLASLSLLGFSIVYFWISRFDRYDTYQQLIWPKLLEGVCLGSFFAPLTALLLHGLPQERQWRAVELATTLRITAGAIGISMQSVLFYFRTAFHQTRFAENHTPLDMRFSDSLERLKDAGFPESSALVRFAAFAREQSAIRAMNDAFWLAGCVFLVLSLIVWVAHPTRQPVSGTLTQSLRRRALALLAREV